MRILGMINVNSLCVGDTLTVVKISETSKGTIANLRKTKEKEGSLK